MDNEESKRSSRSRNPLARIDELGPDLAFAMSLQEEEEEEEQRRRQQEETDFAVLSTIESESQGGISDGEASNNNDDYNYDYFSSQGFGSELGFMEEEDSNSDIEMDELDGIDPDELSYEELLELGDIIGEETRGLSPEQISTCLRPFTFRRAPELKMEIGRCVICQMEYEEGETLASLSCEHSFHSDCVSQWLQIKKTCPICGSEVSTPKN